MHQASATVELWGAGWKKELLQDYEELIDRKVPLQDYGELVSRKVLLQDYGELAGRKSYCRSMMS